MRIDISQLRMEIYGLEELLRQLFLEINYLKNMQERQKWSQTLQGKYFNVIGHFFSVYCLYKIFIVSTCFLNIIKENILIICFKFNLVLR